MADDLKVVDAIEPEPLAKPEGKGDEVAESVKNNVKRWFKLIDKAENKFDSDYNRMRDNMDFVAGIQWNGQKGINYDKYVVNLTLRAVNQGVATLYARNPQVECRRRPRMNFQMWDEKVESLMLANSIMQMGGMLGMPIPPDIQATLADFQQGRLREQLVDKVARTLQLVCQHQMDSQHPRFKLQMKQMVRRVNVCGVGYIKTIFCRDYEGELTQSETRLSLMDRMKMAYEILQRVQDGKVEDTSAEVERLKILLSSVNDQPLDTELIRISEKVTYDFPRATSIIPDPNTRCLKGWIGTHWIAERTFWPLSFVKAFFEADINPDTEVKLYDPNNKPDEGRPTQADEDDRAEKKVCVYHVFDLDTKSDLILCRGYKNYLQSPEPVTPATKGFWNVFPVTFNDVEVEEGCKATIFPPSLVDLIKPAQKEWNSIRQELKKHRRANGPKYMYPDGILDDEDLDAIVESETQQLVKLKGLAPDKEPAKVFQAFPTVDIKKELYDAEPQREDTLLASGQQEANQGPPQPNVTATGVTVAEQSRMGVAASDIDGLDDSLTDVMANTAEIAISEFSEQTVKQVAGDGAVWPSEDPTGFLNEIETEVVAASSGKPNQALELNKWKAISQILVQFGANPQAVIRETIKRFDERIEPQDFFPVALPAPQQPPDGGGSAGAPADRPRPKSAGAKTGQRQRPTQTQPVAGPPSPVEG